MTNATRHTPVLLPLQRLRLRLRLLSHQLPSLNQLFKSPRQSQLMTQTATPYQVATANRWRNSARSSLRLNKSMRKSSRRHMTTERMFVFQGVLFLRSSKAHRSLRLVRKLESCPIYLSMVSIA